VFGRGEGVYLMRADDEDDRKIEDRQVVRRQNVRGSLREVLSANQLQFDEQG
jgi:hypothetical protein